MIANATICHGANGETIRYGPQDEIHQRELCEHFETLIKTTLDNLKEIHVSHLEADFWLK